MSEIIERTDFGRYEVLAKIGEGARGPAFIARVRGDTGADSFCIIELSAFGSGEDDAARAFARDLERVARIRHRNVVRILELGANPTGRYAAMEYVEGCTFAELLDRHRAMRPPRLLLAPILDALDGLHAVHSIEDDGAAQPMLHGSISPGDLRIGLDGTCRVSGFGNLRLRRQTRPSYRGRSEIECTAPEQLTGARVDHRADLFSIGVVLWNALTGRDLFHDPAEHLTMSNVFERKIPRPSTIGLSPPPAFDAIVLRALERDPDRRFQSAAELASELRDVARGAGCLAATDEVGQWVTTTFGGELAAGRRTLLEIAARGPVPPSSPTPEVSVLLQLGAARPAEAPARDAQSPDELSRVTEPAPLLPLPDPLSSAPPLRSPVAEFRLDARPRAPRMLVIAAFAAFGAVVIVLGGRWAMARAPVQDLAVAAPPRPEDRAPAPPELEVTVLAVRTFVPPSPDAVPPRPDLAPAPAIAPAPPSAAPPAPVAAPAAAPPRSVARGKRPARSPPEVRTPAPARPSDVRPEPPDTRAPEAHPAAPPTRPESPSKPALETNPYLYK